jgi:hypothetical protein
MTFNLDQLIHKNYEQTLKDYLSVNSLENYDVKIEQLPPQSKSQFFNICFNLTYKLSILKNNLLAITATSKTYNNEIFSLTNQNHVKKLYDSNSIDFSTINSFETTNPEIESKAYSLSISSRTEKNKNKRFNILLQINKITIHILTTPFTEKYLIEYKLNKDIEAWSNELKNNLIDNNKENKSIPNREDLAYKKIESFKPHELTYKIFYEMATRNKDASKIVNALNYLHDINSMQKNEIKIDEIDCRIEDDKKVYTVTGTVNIDDITNCKVFIGINDCKVQCVDSIDDNKFEVEILVDKEVGSLDLYIAVGSDTYQDDKIGLGLPVANSILMIRSTTTGVLEKNKETTISIKIDKEKSSISPDKDGSWLLDLNSSQKALTTEILLQKYHSFLKPEEHQIYFSTGVYFINALIGELETQLIEEYLIYPDNYDVSHPEKSDILLQRASKNAYDAKKLQSDSSYKHEDNYFFKQDEYDGYSIHQGISKNADSRYNLSTIKQDSTKQVVDYNVSNFQINLNLPKDELISYLKKIKDNYDNDNSILKSPMELFGEEVGIEPEEIRNMDSLKWADTFYIYDTFQYLTLKQNKLENENEKSIDRLNNELLAYKKPGRKTEHEKRMIKKIEKKYKIEIQKYEKKIKETGKTSQAKYLKISKKIIVSESTIQKYIKFMEKNILEKQYRKLL